MNRKLTELVSEIEKERRELIRVVEGLSQAQLDWQNAPGEWSIGEVLDHLHIIERRINKLLNIQAARAEELGIGPDSNQDSMLGCLDEILDNVPAKIKAPEVTTPKGLIPKEDLLQALRISRARLLESVGNLEHYDLTQLLVEHPMFGEMNLYRWILLVGKHEHRHADQIRNILAAQALLYFSGAQA